MNNSKNKTEISFRFTRLDKMQAYTLEREIVGDIRDDNVDDRSKADSHVDSQTNVKTNTVSNDRNHKYVVYVPLTENNFDDINDYYVRQRIEIETCDIFISVSAESGTNILEVPAIVNRMLKYIDCKLTFSFTVL